MAMLLEGIRVLDWTVAQQGPIAGMMLGDLGADVIKIEGPVGEMGREYTVTRHPLVGDRNFYFETNNRNKRALILDFKNKEAREILYRLVEKCDIFLHNYGKGISKRLGMDYETLSKYNPRLIYASGSTFGSEGPEGDKPGLDVMGMARSGMMSSIGYPDWPPVYADWGLGDQIGAITLTLGILGALVARERFGIGQEVSASLLGSIIQAEALNVMCYLLQGQERQRRPRENPRNPMWNWFKCADDKWLVLAMSRDKYWHDFCKALRIEELETNEKFSSLAKRAENAVELTAIFDKVFATKPRDEWLKILGEYEDFLFTYFNNIPDLVNDPQVLANKYIVDYDHPVLGKVKEVGFPVAFSKTPASIRREAPMHGQHTEEVLMEVLGYTWEDIERLREREVF